MGAAGLTPGGFPFFGSAHRPRSPPWTPQERFGRRPVHKRKPAKAVGRIAQLVEQLTLNQRVPGSSPGAPTTIPDQAVDLTDRDVLSIATLFGLSARQRNATRRGRSACRETNPPQF